MPIFNYLIAYLSMAPLVRTNELDYRLDASTKLMREWVP
jgi:hypothetical protein